MRHRSTFIISSLAFIIGCMLTLSIMNLDTCDINRNILKKKTANHKLPMELIALIFSDPSNVERRRIIRNTWLKLNFQSSQELLKKQPLQLTFKYYFVVGVSSVSDDVRILLRNEQSEFNDLLILPNLKDHYTSLSEKLLQSIQWINTNHLNLLYMLKCDDDSFVRINLLLNELYLNMPIPLDYTSRSDGNLDQKKLHETKESMPGLYWGYFKGNAHVRIKGRWAEQDWFLCDEYLPYALGGGYVLSKDILEFISMNSHYLKLYNSEDVSVGVWTAPLSRVHRYHDSRFDTEWSSRGCNNTFIIRHKRSIQDMQNMYDSLIKSDGKILCEQSYTVRPSYEYNWSVPPSQCCEPAK